MRTSGQFYYIIYTETTKLRCFKSWQPSGCDVVKSCLNYSRPGKHRKCKHFFE